MPALARQQCDGMPPLCSWCPPRLVEELSPVLRACLQALLDFFLCLKVSPLDPTAMGLPASRLPPPRCFAGRFPESLPCPSPGGCPPNLEERLPQNFRHCTAPRPPDIGRSEHLWWLVLWRCGCFPLVAAFSLRSRHQCTTEGGEMGRLVVAAEAICRIVQAAGQTANGRC